MITISKKEARESKEYANIVPGETFIFFEDYCDQHKTPIGPGHLLMKVKTENRILSVNFVGKEVSIPKNQLVVPVDLTIDWSVDK